MTKREFWDALHNKPIEVTVQTHEDVLQEMYKTLKALHERVSALETAYMEEKLLDQPKRSDKIES